MSVGFGFSVGDFLAALELVGTVIDALRESGQASAGFRELIAELESLKTALDLVNRLQVHDSQKSELLAVQKAAAQCQTTIDNFWAKVQKYEPYLTKIGTTSRLREGWMKIKWAVCKKEDPATFKIDIHAHTASIQILLLGLQTRAIVLQEHRQAERQRSLKGMIQDQYQNMMGRLSVVANCVASGATQGAAILETTMRIVQTNIHIFEIVLDIQHYITRIPGQIQRQQPVYLIDARGRDRPFHLEFITCAEALISVLHIHLRDVGQASKKTDRGEYVITDSATNRDIDLTRNWDLCFSPGQHVDMSMIFNRDGAIESTSCPSCQTVNTNVERKKIVCSNPVCGLVYYQRLADIDEDDKEVQSSAGVGADPKTYEPANLQAMEEEDRGSAIEDEDITLFRRVRICLQPQKAYLDDQSRGYTPLHARKRVAIAYMRRLDDQFPGRTHLHARKNVAIAYTRRRREWIGQGRRDILRPEEDLFLEPVGPRKGRFQRALRSSDH